jgi:hypothetical protein
MKTALRTEYGCQGKSASNSVASPPPVQKKKQRAKEQELRDEEKERENKAGGGRKEKSLISRSEWSFTKFNWNNLKRLFLIFGHGSRAAHADSGAFGHLRSPGAFCALDAAG